MTDNKAVLTLLNTCAGARKDEKILFVTDDTSAEIARFMWENTKDYPNRAMVMMTDRQMHGANPPETVAAAMLNADVVFGITKYSLFHSVARRACVANGARFVNMADYHIEMMTSGGLFADFIGQGERMNRFSDAAEGKEIHIVTEMGTDLRCSIEGRAALRQYGRSLNPGASSSPPDIETALGPVEGTMNGTLVVDGSIPFPGLGVLHEAITVEIKDGMIVSITGGKEADILRSGMESLQDQKAYIAAEIGFGFNNESKLCNSMLEDEGVMGTLHIGFGNSLAFGGSCDSINHIDMIFKDASVWVDGRQLIDCGKILVD